VTQASSSWRQLINKFPEIKIESPKQRSLKRFLGTGGVLGFLTIIVSLLIWNWQLFLALVVGISVMVLAYSMQKWNWSVFWSEIRRFLSKTNSHLAIAVVSGGIATVITYMTIAIWLDANSPWIATAAIIQGFGTLLTLIFMVCQIFSLQGNREEEYLQQLLNNLTEPDPVKRFIAVNQLTKFLNRQSIAISTQQDIFHCFRLLLNQEDELVIREAIFNSLQTLDCFPPVVKQE
jgi:hypothetical protein